MSALPRYARAPCAQRPSAQRPSAQQLPAQARVQRSRGAACTALASHHAELLVVAAERLLPAELDQGTQQAQGQLPVPPRPGVDAGVLQRVPVERDRRFLELRQAAAVDGQVPGQVTERRADPGLFPVQHDGPPRVVGAEVVQLPVAVHERMRRHGQRVNQRARIVGQWGHHRGGCRCHVGQHRPALAHQLRHEVRGPAGRLGLGHPGRQLEITVHGRDHVELGAARPERGVQRGHVPQEPQVLGHRDDLIRGRDQPGRHIVHQQGAAPGPGGSPAGGALFRGGPHDRLVEAAGQAAQDAPLPELQRGAPQRAGRAHGPVLAQVEVLEHVGLAADDDPLQPGPGLARDLLQDRPPGHPGQKLGHVAVAAGRGGRRVGVAAAGGAGPGVRHRPLPSRPAGPHPSGHRRTRCRRRYGRRAP